MTAPQSRKPVGFGGCLVSLVVFVVSVVVFFGFLVWALTGVVNDLKSSPSVAVGTSGSVTITKTGPQFVFLGNLDGNGTIPASDPLVRIVGPDGNDVPISPPSSTSSQSGSSGSFRTIGEFEASTAGTYQVESSGEAVDGARVYVTDLNIGSLGAKILVAIGLGGILFLLSVVLAIVWLVRRSRAKSAA